MDLTVVSKLGNMKGGHYLKVDYNNLMEKVTFLPIKYSWGFVQFSMSHYCPLHPSFTMDSFGHLCPKNLFIHDWLKSLGLKLGVEISCSLLKSGYFNSRLQPWTFQFKDENFMSFWLKSQELNS